jgi:hypothetical protein
VRHHGATTALNAGFIGEIVMAPGGWKSGKILRRYAAVTDHTLALLTKQYWSWVRGLS